MPERDFDPTGAIVAAVARNARPKPVIPEDVQIKQILAKVTTAANFSTAQLLKTYNEARAAIYQTDGVEATKIFKAAGMVNTTRMKVSAVLVKTILNTLHRLSTGDEKAVLIDDDVPEAKIELPAME